MGIYSLAISVCEYFLFKSVWQLICQINMINTRCCYSSSWSTAGHFEVRSGLRMGPLCRRIACVNSRSGPPRTLAWRRYIRCHCVRSPVLLVLCRRSVGDRPLAIRGCRHSPRTAVSLSRGWGSADPPSSLLLHYL